MANLHKNSSGKAKKIHKLVETAEKMRLVEKIDEAMNYLTLAKEMNKNLGNQHLEALILEGFGFCYETSDNFEKAERMATDARVMFQELGGPVGNLGNANGLICLGNIYGRLGRYKEAIRYQEQAVEILLRMRKQSIRGQRKKKTVKGAIPFSPEILRQKRERSLGIAYGNMGEAHNELAEYERGLDLSQDALNINREFKDEFEEARNLLNMGSACCHSGRLKKSIEYCEKSAQIFTKIGNKKGASTAYGVLGIIFMNLGDVQNSQRYYNMCAETNRKMNQFADLAIVYGNNGQLNYYMGLQKFLSFGDAKENLKNSVENFKQAIESSDKVLRSLSVDDNRTAFSDRFYRWYDELTAPFNLLGRSAAALLFLDLGRAKILRQLVYRHVSFQENHDGELAFESSWLTIENKKERERICDLSKKIQLLESDATVLFYNFNRAQILTIWVLDAKGCVSLKTTDPSSNFLTAQEELEDNVEMVLDSASVGLPRGYSFFNQSAVVDVKAQDKNMKASHDDKEVKDSKTKRDLRSPAKTGAFKIPPGKHEKTDKDHCLLPLAPGQTAIVNRLDKKCQRKKPKSWIRCGQKSAC